MVANTVLLSRVFAGREYNISPPSGGDEQRPSLSAESSYIGPIAPVSNTTTYSYFLRRYLHSTRLFPCSKFAVVFPVSSRVPEPFCFRVPYLAIISVKCTAGMFREWIYLILAQVQGVFLLFIYITPYYIYFACILLRENILYIAFAPVLHLSLRRCSVCPSPSRFRLVPRRPHHHRTPTSLPLSSHHFPYTRVLRMGWPTRTTIVLRSPSPELDVWYFIYQLALSGTVSVSTRDWAFPVLRALTPPPLSPSLYFLFVFSLGLVLIHTLLSR